MEGLSRLRSRCWKAKTIEYLVRFEGLQDLFGLGRWGTGFNLIVGPAEFWVRADDADHARERLEGLGAPSLEGTVPSDDNG